MVLLLGPVEHTVVQQVGREEGPRLAAKTDSEPLGVRAEHLAGDAHLVGRQSCTKSTSVSGDTRSACRRPACRALAERRLSLRASAKAVTSLQAVRGHAPRAEGSNHGTADAVAATFQAGRDQRTVSDNTALGLADLAVASQVAPPAKLATQTHPGSAGRQDGQSEADGKQNKIWSVLRIVVGRTQQCGSRTP